MEVLKPSDMKQRKEEELTPIEKAYADQEVVEELAKAKGERSEYMTEGGQFKGGFEGCVRYQRNVKGLGEESARKLCAYIGRRAGKIP